MCKIYCVICAKRIKVKWPPNLIKHWLWRYFPLGRKLRDILATHFWNFSIFFICEECQKDIDEMEDE